jgi:hypothetical protein
MEAILKQILEQLTEIKTLIKSDIDEKKAAMKKYHETHAHNNKSHDMIATLVQQIIAKAPGAPITPILQEIVDRIEEQKS